MEWTPREVEVLSPILERFASDLESLQGRFTLVLCSAGGEVAFWLARKLAGERVVGLELDDGLLQTARQKSAKEGLNDRLEFRKADRARIAFGDETFHAVVSEFILYPTPSPTQIGQREIARVLRPGGVVALTDVILTRRMSADLRTSLKSIGLDYLCEGTQDDFQGWMRNAGLTDIEVQDLTPLVREVWERRAEADPNSEHGRAYDVLLQDPTFRLGRSLFYIYARARKPPLKQSVGYDSI